MVLESKVEFLSPISGRDACRACSFAGDFHAVAVG